ncbi:hypothetical protein [Deinococcus yunweiensis]|uniref:sunset domain-containing protein n=1 Tax=Deinococcus yunweiensis TaxID=367282 RepID=UPI00398E7196
MPEPLTAPVPAPDTAPDATSGPVTPQADGSCPQTDPVKVSKAGVYDLPQGDANYGRTKAVACFVDAASAEAAGYRGVK